MESSKKILGKITPFGERIIKVLKDNNLVKQNGEVNYSEAERITGIKGGALSKAVQAKGMHDGNLEKFLGKFHVEQEWLLHGRGPMQSHETKQNGTGIQKAIDNRQNEKTPRETFYLDLIENNAEYNLIPRAVLKDYKMVPDKIIDVIISSAENEKRALREAMDEAKTSLIQKYESIIEGKNHRIEELLKLNDELRKQIPT